ncbi:hypothetical protein HG531_007497 [Fusarium graminearum]|nr:hypothetical protein HG531_007497 [Fusarium graminearum]
MGTYCNVDNELDLGNIKTTGSDISSNKNRSLSRLKGLETPCSLLLSQITVDTTNADTLAAQEVLNTSGLLLVQAENQNTVVLLASLLVLLQDLEETEFLPSGLKNLNALCEHECLALLARRARAENHLNILLETLVKHTVGLVKNGEGRVAKIDSSIGHEIFKTTGCCDNDVSTTVEEVSLVILGSTTVEADTLHPVESRNGSHLLIGLHSEFSCRRNNNSLGVLVLEGRDGLNTGKRESHCLSGSCLGNTNHITAREGERP